MRTARCLAAISIPLIVLAQPRWEVRMNGLTENGAFYSVSVVDSHTVWVVANGGRVWKSFDAGKSWVAASSLPQGAGDAIGTVAVTSPRDVVLATTTGKILKTTDGGVAWIKVFDDTTVTDFFNDLEMFDDFTGFAIGDPPNASSSKPPGFVSTTDGGQTWTVVNTNLPLGDSQYHGRTDFIRPDVGWTYVLNDGVYRTTDAGKTWNKMSSLLSFNELFFLNDSVGFYTWSGYPSDGGISKTTDGGLTWRKTLSGSQIVFVRWAPGGKRLWAGGDSLYLSTDVGETWQEDFSAKSMGACGLLWEASFLTDDIGMISGQCTVLGMSSDPLVSVGIQKWTPEGLELMQNYPNPFNPSTTIRYEVPSRTHVVLEILNVLGREVGILVDGVKDPGSYEVSWNGTGISSGVYFYRLQAGQSVKTKKLLLVR